jgi:phenylpropionate dioxygenase-like ring-hydroxylating dioxygenase large terminal subunit
MGNLMRQYWLPCVTSDDLEADGPPLRVRLLGENLIAFRTTSGPVGLITDVCPHRCASLFFGRNEEDGLRCVYHGWKFDVTGACVDMPGEPEEANFKDRVTATAYPCVERNGIVWTYMGPRETPPPLPDLEANMVSQSRVSRTLRYCNWLQALEGDIDTLHSEYLHSPARVDLSALTPGTGGYYRHRLRDKLQFVAIDTEFGTSYAAYRPAEENTTYWRIAHFLFPFITMTPTNAAGSAIIARIWVPVDDEHVLFWTVGARSNQPQVGMVRPESMNRSVANGSGATDGQFGGIELLPDTSDWLGRFRPVQRAENDYLIDRQDQKDVTFTGIANITMQDTTVTESMGALLDRTKEHLGVSDTMIIRTRQRLLNAARALEDGGIVPPGVDNPEIYRTRSGWCILPNGVDWIEGSRELREAFVEQKDVSIALAGLQQET